MTMPTIRRLALAALLLAVPATLASCGGSLGGGGAEFGPNSPQPADSFDPANPPTGDGQSQYFTSAHLQYLLPHDPVTLKVGTTTDFALKPQGSLVILHLQPTITTTAGGPTVTYDPSPVALHIDATKAVPGTYTMNVASTSQYANGNHPTATFTVIVTN